MSQRFGMADGRCFTIGTSSRLLNDYMMSTNNIQYQDNYSYRQLLQSQGPALIDSFQNAQQPSTGPGQCVDCNNPLLKVPHIY